MTGSWVLRWDTLHEEKPRVVYPGPGTSEPAVCEAASGSFALLEGYLFDRAEAPDDATATDASQALSAYERYGDGLFDRLRGGFTLAVWDQERRRLIVGRDPMGLCLCFYSWDGRVFLMSSELDAILAQPEVERRFNRVVIAEYIQNAISSHQHEETFYERIRRLPPAHTLVLSNGRLSISRYWDPIPPGFKWASEEELASFQPVLERAVSRCLSVGADSVALSGGFDSVSIAVLAGEQRRGASPLHAVSLRFIDTVCDEVETQTEVARTLGMPQMMRTIAESLNGETFVSGALAFSQFSCSPILSIWQSVYTGLMRSASERGLRKLLMGTGGDDLLNVDYSYGRDCLTAGNLRGLWRYYRAWQRTSPFSALCVAREVLWYGAFRPELARRAAALLGRFGPSVKAWLRRQQSDTLQPWISRADVDLVSALECRRRNPRPIAWEPQEGFYVRDMRTLTQAPLLLQELDQGATWAKHCGFTLLYPYFDRDLVELLLRVYPEHLIAGGRAKGPLRRLVAERLPTVQMRQKKVDFSQMIHTMLRPDGEAAWRKLRGPRMLAELGIVDPNHLEPVLQEYFSGRNSQSLRTWLILSTEMWLRARSGEPFIK